MCVVRLEGDLRARLNILLRQEDLHMFYDYSLVICLTLFLSVANAEEAENNRRTEQRLSINGIINVRCCFLPIVRVGHRRR